MLIKQTSCGKLFFDQVDALRAATCSAGVPSLLYNLSAIGVQSVSLSTFENPFPTMNSYLKKTRTTRNNPCQAIAGPDLSTQPAAISGHKPGQLLLIMAATAFPLCLVNPGPPALAAAAPPAAAARPVRHWDWTVEQMDKRVSLTDDQKGRMQDLVEASQAQTKALQADKTLSDKDREQKLRDLRTDEDKKTRALLTAEQLNKLEDIENRDRAQGRTNWQVGEMGKVITLTDDQKAHIFSIYLDAEQRILTLRKESFLASRERDDLIGKIYTTADADVRGSVTSDQQQKLQDADDERNAKGHADWRIQEMSKVVLTDDQKTHIQKIFLDAERQASAIRRNSSLPQRSRDDQTWQISLKADAAARSSLTPDQQQKLQDADDVQAAKGRTEGEIRNFEKSITLTDDQKNHIGQVYLDTEKQATKIRQDTSLQPRDRDDQVNKLYEKARRTVRESMTADQQQKLDEADIEQQAGWATDGTVRDLSKNLVLGDDEKSRIHDALLTNERQQWQLRKDTSLSQHDRDVRSGVLWRQRATGIKAALSNPNREKLTQIEVNREVDGRIEDAVKQLTLGVAITPEQRIQIHHVLEEQQRQLDEMQTNPDVSDSDRGIIWRKIDQSTQPKLEGVLTAEQRQQISGLRQTEVAQRETDDWLKKNAVTLALTDAQKAQIQPILMDAGRQSEVVREDKKLWPTEADIKIRRIHDAANTRIKALLTPEQQQNWGKGQ